MVIVDVIRCIHIGVIQFWVYVHDGAIIFDVWRVDVVVMSRLFCVFIDKAIEDSLKQEYNGKKED